MKIESRDFSAFFMPKKEAYHKAGSWNSTNNDQTIVE